MAGRRDTPAFAKGIARTVRGSLKRFVALTTITALGVTMLVGLRAACVDLRNSADRFFDEQSLFDVRVQSTLGLTDEDVAALAALDGVETAEGGWSETVYTTVGSASEKVDVKALSPSGLNEPLVLEGRLPEVAGEVAVTQRYLKDSGLSIGDSVSFHGDDDQDDDAEKDDGLDALDSGSTEVFERGEYAIVGSVLDPMEINAGEGTMSFRSSGGSQYSFFVVSDEVIDQSVYTVAYVMVEGAEAPLCYSAEYEEIVDEVFQSVEDARAERERARGDQIRSDANEEVDEAEAEALEELADAEAELDDAQRELDEGRAEVADGQRELDEQREDAMAQLDDAQATIDESRRELEDGAAEYEAGLAEYAEYREGLAAYEAALPGAEQQLRDGQAALDAARGNIDEIVIDEDSGMTIGDLDAQRDEAQAAVDTLPGTIAGIDEKVGALADGLDALASGLQAAGMSDPGLAESAQQVRDAWTAVQAVEAGDAEATEEATAQLESAIAGATNALGVVSQGLAVQVEEAERNLEEVTRRIDELQAADPESSDLPGLLAQQQGLQAALTTLGGYQESIDALSASLSAADPAQLVSGRVQAAAGLAQAEAALPQLEAAVEQARGAAETEFDRQQALIDQGWQELSDGRAQLESARALLDQSAAQIADGRAQLAEGQAELDRQRADALAQLADAQAQLDNALAEIADGQAELDEGRATFEQERDDALTEIADAREEIADLPDATWYVQDRSSLSSYASVDSDASSIEAIGTVLPIVFFVVAVLISAHGRGGTRVHRRLQGARLRQRAHPLQVRALCAVGVRDRLARGHAARLHRAPGHHLHDLLDHVRAAGLRLRLRRGVLGGLASALHGRNRGRDGAHLPPRAARDARLPHAAQGPQGRLAHLPRAHRARLAAHELPEQGHGAQPLPLQAALLHDHVWRGGLRGAAHHRLWHSRYGALTLAAPVR